MGSLHETNPSLWVATTDEYLAPPLTAGDLSVDVAVLGGGIAGICTATLLAREGARVAVIEAGRIASGATGYTTAKVTSLHGLIYASLADRFGEDQARLYGEANQAALERIASLVQEGRIDCDFTRMPAFTYTELPDRVADIEAEARVAAAIGLPASFTTETDLPLEVKGAVRFKEQALFHPRKFCLALARNLIADGHYVFETTRALDVKEGTPCEVVTDQGKLRAVNVVVATHLPFLGRGMFYSKASPSRSYAIATLTDGPMPGGMYLNAESPTRSIRPHPMADRTYLLIGGEGHDVGDDDDTRRRYAALESWARTRFGARSVEYRWSAQDYMPTDGVPYIGLIDGDAQHVYVATGFGKWGMTTGMVSAMIITDQIGGRRNQWAPVFDSKRIPAARSPGQFIADTAQVAAHLIGDKIGAMIAPGPGSITVGEGRIVDQDGTKLAVYQDAAGTHAVAAECTHMGCIVKWNTAEATWDCPCHGSRFDVEGHVIQGPAVEDLQQKTLKQGANPAA